jgi:hypothetical protein
MRKTAKNLKYKSINHLMDTSSALRDMHYGHLKDHMVKT